MLRFAGAPGAPPLAPSPQRLAARASPSLLERLAAAEVSDDEEDASAPLPHVPTEPLHAGFDQPDVLLIGDHVADLDEDDEENAGDAAGGEIACGEAMLERQEHAEQLYRGLDFLRASGVEEGSSVFQGQLAEFLTAAGDLFGRTGGRLPSDIVRPADAGESSGDSDSDAMEEEGGMGDVVVARRGREKRQPAAGGVTAAVPRDGNDEDGGSAEEEEGDEAGGDDPLYDPSADDDDARWVLANLARLRSSGGGAGGGAGAEAGGAMQDGDNVAASAPAADVVQPTEAAGVHRSSSSSLPSEPAAAAGGAAAAGAPPATAAVLSCPGCFTAVCYECRPHARQPDVFVADARAAVGVSIDRSEPVSVGLPPSARLRATGASTEAGLTVARAQHMSSWSVAAAAAAAAGSEPAPAIPAAAPSEASGEGEAAVFRRRIEASAKLLWPPVSAAVSSGPAQVAPTFFAVSCSHCGCGLGVFDDKNDSVTFLSTLAGDG